MQTGILNGVLVLFGVFAWIYMLYDCYYRAKSHKAIWLALIFLTGVVGYIIFYFSPDRA